MVIGNIGDDTVDSPAFATCWDRVYFLDRPSLTATHMAYVSLSTNLACTPNTLAHGRDLPPPRAPTLVLKLDVLTFNRRPNRLRPCHPGGSLESAGEARFAPQE